MKCVLAPGGKWKSDEVPICIGKPANSWKILNKGYEMRVTFTNTTTLQIKNVHPGENGIYKCETFRTPSVIFISGIIIVGRLSFCTVLLKSDPMIEILLAIIMLTHFYTVMPLTESWIYLYLEPPSLNNLSISHTKTPVIETEPFIAICNLTAVKNETITYRWIKDDEETDYKTGVLSLSSVSRNDAGRYICRASNVAGHVNKSFTLQVHCE